jgi:hypothetical protein
MPMTVPRPVRGKMAFINSAAPSTPSSTFEIARATARGSPLMTRSANVRLSIKQ